MRCSNVAAPDPAPPVAGAWLDAMAEGDLDEVLAIERSSFISPWNRSHFLHEIRQNAYAINRVIRHQGVVLGYACVWELQGELKINNFAIRPDHRGAGLGRWMLGRALEGARLRGCSAARLEVRASNRAAIRLYENDGFVQVGRRPGYYQAEEEDAILMELRL